MFELSILVVLYNKELEESLTIKSFLNNEKLLGPNINFVIWNNGPINLKSTFIKISDSKVNVIETINNISLSEIYNEFLEKNKAKKYLLLDHDSILSKDFILDVLSFSSMVSLPVINSLGIPVAPILRGGFIPSGIYPNKGIVSVGSGLCFSNYLKNILKEKYGQVFDPRFYFYGVDTTFFIRLESIEKCNEIYVLSAIEHSLSKTESESKSLKEFRRIERSYDLGLRLRYYPSIKFFYILIKKIFSTFLGIKNEIDIKKLFIAFYLGKHYKDNN